MFEKNGDVYLVKFMEVLEQRIRSIPTKRLHNNATSSLGSYVDISLEMVNLEQVIREVKKLVIEPDLQGITSLLEKLWQQTEKNIRSLPNKKIKVDPLAEYNKSATLFLEEYYVELKDVLELIRRLKNSLVLIQDIIVESLCQLIKLKAGWLQGNTKNRGGLIIDTENFPKLEGEKEEVERGSEIRGSAIASLLQSDSVSDFSPTAKAYIQTAIDQMTSASWWIENEHRTTRAILLLISNALDEALLMEVVSV